MAKAEQPPTHFVIESSDRDELSDYFSRRVSRVSISPVTRAETVAIAAAAVPLGSAVAFEADIPKGARFRQGEELDGFLVHIPVGKGHAHWKIGSKELVSSPTTAYLGPMYEKDTVDFIGQWRHQALKISYDQMARNLVELLDSPLTSRLEFAPTVDLTSASAKALTSLVQVALTPLNGEPFLSASPMAATQFSESLSLLLLENFRHNYTDAMTDGVYSLKPIYVKRAIEFMRANAHLPLTLQTIANAAGVSARALHYGFKSFVGVPPFDHLRKIRLDKAYRDLKERPEMSVVDVAKKWGFTNPARFAQLCKGSYGYLPSEIRQAARRAAPSR